MEELSSAGTRTRILKAAEALLGERGYAGTRLHEIAERVGVQKASLFHYFASKQDLYRAVLAEGYGETERTIRGALEREGSPFDGLRALTEAYVDIVSAHPERTKILLRQSLGEAPAEALTEDAQRLIRIVVDYIERFQATKYFAPADAQALVLGVIGAVAFFFTSAPMVASATFADPASEECVRRIKRHVVDTLRHCLLVEGAGPSESPARAVV